MTTLPLILCRGGSKSIPRKNIKLLNGKPLLSYSLGEALKMFPEVYVSTDDKEIKEVAEKYGAKVIDRPAELAQDDSKSVEGVQHSLRHLQEHYGFKFDYIMLLNACTPFNDAISMSEFVKIGLRNKADSMVSLVESFESHPSKLCHLNKDNLVLPLGEFETGERQKQEKIYRRNTCMYMATKETIMSGSFFGKKNYGFVMSQEKSLDINTPHDFLMAELYMKHLTQ